MILEEKMNKKILENKLSTHRPAWASKGFDQYNHLHMPARKNGKVVAPIRENHFIKTAGFATVRDRRYYDGEL